MPLIITRGLGEDEHIIYRYVIGDKFQAEIVQESSIAGELVEEEEAPIAEVEDTIAVDGSLTEYEVLSGELIEEDVLVGYLREGQEDMEDKRLQIFQGNDRTLAFALNNPGTDPPTPVNLTGAQITFSVKENMNDADDQAVFQKKNTAAGGGDDEILITDAPGGRAEIYILRADTLSITSRNLVWDVEVALANGKTYTVLRGTMTVKEAVTGNT